MNDRRARASRHVLTMTPRSALKLVGDYAADYDLEQFSMLYNMTRTMQLQGFLDTHADDDIWDDAHELELRLAVQAYVEIDLEPLFVQCRIVDARSGAALAGDLHLIGLDTKLHTVIPAPNGGPLDPSRVRQWVSGRRPISPVTWKAVDALRREHDALVDSWLSQEGTVTVELGERPKEWYVAAIARVRAVRPDARFRWA